MENTTLIIGKYPAIAKPLLVAVAFSGVSLSARLNFNVSPVFTCPDARERHF